METVKKYSWKYQENSKYDANVVGQEFEAIERENGVVTKQAIVDRARPETAPMHGMFEWDDEVAGELYRLEQAHGYIRRLVVEVVPIGEKIGKPIKLRGFLNVTPINKSAVELPGRYINYNSAISDPETYGVVLQRAKRELTTFKNKYSNFEELKPVFTVIDEVCGDIKNVG